MPRIIETTVYEINELPEAAKARARDWYILNVLDNDAHWYRVVFNDFQKVCGILGITLQTRSTERSGSGETSAEEPCIWFSGFSHQGDGASFDGTWEYASECCRRIRRYAPLDERLHKIAKALTAAQRPNFYELGATITQQGHYNHEYCMRIEVDRNSEASREPTEGSAEAVADALRDLARWLYRQLEAQYDRETTNSVIDQVIEANEWPFTANGAFFAN